MADIRELEQHRTALTGHCYRMLGSPLDADDAVQETMVRAWKALERFDGRSSLRTWLYRIATNVCLDALAERKRRARPFEERGPGSITEELVALDRSHWLEPIPDARAIPSDADPAEQAMLRQSIRLAFVAALQHLPPKQRAVLLLTEVLGWSATDVAGALDTSTASVNSALQRARATLAERDVLQQRELTADQRATVDKYFSAFERYDIDALATLLTEDAILNMPPFTMWLQGPEIIHTWMTAGPGAGCRGSRIVRLDACGLPAFGQYRDGGATPFALVTVELTGDRVGRMTSFLDTEKLFPLFGLPPRLDR